MKQKLKTEPTERRPPRVDARISNGTVLRRVVSRTRFTILKGTSMISKACTEKSQMKKNVSTRGSVIPSSQTSTAPRHDVLIGWMKAPTRRAQNRAVMNGSKTLYRRYNPPTKAWQKSQYGKKKEKSTSEAKMEIETDAEMCMKEWKEETTLFKSRLFI